MSAYFSDCRRYRYTLMRDLGLGGTRGTITFIMLNPSTADEIKNDPTIERCTRRAMMMGFSKLVVLNIFAFRSTDPRALYEVADPIGPENNGIIVRAAREADFVICGWGEHGKLAMRGLHVRRMLTRRSIAIHSLAINSSGEPKHPLYVGYSAQPQAML